MDFRALPAAAFLALLLSTASKGDITYSLEFNPASSPEAQQVANSVAVASAFYNQHGSFNKHWYVYHNPGIPTAEANVDGYMGYGGIRNERVVFHEAAHTFGMGTHGRYPGLIAGGVWKGAYGRQAELDTYNTYGDGLHGDGHAIWPGGFNYDNEDGFIQRIWHTRIMAAIRTDMGILSYTREARNEAVMTGQTAQFHVEAPLATSWQWFKNGGILNNGGDVSGATSPTLRIAHADASDAAIYHCSTSGAGETLSSRPRQLWVHPSPQLGQWNFDGSPVESLHARNGTAFGSPNYVSGKIGQAIDLDGGDDYIDLPDEAGRLGDLTVATWVNWDGGGNWQRVFDFGTGTYQYLFLCPGTPDGKTRLALKDAINGRNVEYLIDGPGLPIGRWVHLAAVLRRDYMTLYINGKPVGSAFNLDSSPADFPATNNYIGKSQYADPLYNGSIDDFRVYGKALDGAEIWSIWGQSPNAAPQFNSPENTLPPAEAQQSYSGQSIASLVTDANGDPLTFAKLNGPAWVSISSSGNVSGTPTFSDNQGADLVVRATDPFGATSDAFVHIPVSAAGTVAHWNFEEGTANTPVPYGSATGGQFDGSITDLSGYGNPLSAWTQNWHWYRPEVPAPVTPRTGATNHLSIQNAGSYPALSAIGTPLTQWSPTAWTIEAAIRPDDATNGYQTFIGRDSRGASAGNPALAALYFSVLPNGGIRFLFTDVAGNTWQVDSAANTAQDGKWLAVAATSDGSTLSLYGKDMTLAESSYTLLASADISSSTNPSITTGTGDGADWDAGVFSIARGLYDGGHTDRFFGFLDDIRFTDGTLDPSEFLYSVPPPSPADAWRNTHFGTTANSGNAADLADPDGDGVTNLLERAFGGDPLLADHDLLPDRDETASFFSILYRKSLAATDLDFQVQESHDLSADWSPATGESEVVATEVGTQLIRFTRAPGSDTSLFLRLAVAPR